MPGLRSLRGATWCILALVRCSWDYSSDIDFRVSGSIASEMGVVVIIALRRLARNVEIIGLAFAVVRHGGT